MIQRLILVVFLLFSTHWLRAQVLPADRELAEYFKAETGKISTSCLSDVKSLADWKARQPEFRRRVAEMMGLDPVPERTELNAVITGKIEQDTFTVEKLYFQSSPHLYVTANLYLPKHFSKPAPAVLYLCGHSSVITNGVSCGNKTAYQHHGIWFARHGYVCLVLDTLQLGEILGDHYGTFREGKWLWNSRGYTPAGVEVWNAIRGLDYLDSRPEVDTNRIGVTGRSGGGAYSWFLAALDDRVKVVAPVAGITDLENYVVDGAVDGHCDCMFLVNTYRWDYPLLAALCAPRPLLLANSDDDNLFPLNGVMRTRNKVKKIYDLYGASTNFGLVITPGPHKDTQDLQMPVFRWFNIHLKHEDPIIETAAVKMFAPEQLRVFGKIPDDQINTHVQDSFVASARAPDFPASAEAWKQICDAWMKDLREKCFTGWPTHSGPPKVTQIFSEKEAGIQYEGYEIQAQENVTLRLYLMRKAGSGKPRKIIMHMAGWSFINAPVDATSGLSPAILETMSYFGTREVVQGLAKEIKDKSEMEVVFLPRGIGPRGWSGGTKRLAQLRRRFMLLGQTLDGMRVWDIRRAVQALRCLNEYRQTPLTFEAEGDMGVNALYASLFEPGIDALSLRHIPSSHAEGPDYLNVLKYLDIPQAAAMVSERCRLRLQSDETEGWDFLRGATASPVVNLKPDLMK